MTKNLLEQYPDIVAELDELVRDARTAVSEVVSGSGDEYPFTQHPVTVRGLPLEQHRERIAVLRRQKAEIEAFVDALPNSKLRRVVTMRAMRGMSWQMVAAKMGYRYSEEGVRKIYSRVFSLFLDF